MENPIWALVYNYHVASLLNVIFLKPTKQRDQVLLLSDCPQCLIMRLKYYCTLYKKVDGLALRVGTQFVVGRTDVREETTSA